MMKDSKERYKLYKSGKLWVTAMISASILFTTGVITAHADSNNSAPTTTAIENVSLASASDASGNALITSNKATVNVASNQPSQAAPAVNQNFNHFDNGNYGYVDSAHYQNNQLHVSGWSASNNNQGRSNHYIIAYDNTTRKELGRQKVTQPIHRPDVQKVHNVYNADWSGYDVVIPIAFNNMSHGNDSISIISRYANSSDGNTDYVDNWSRPIALDVRNYGWLDSANVHGGHLTVSGWHATNLAINRPHHFILLFDQTANHEVAQRVLINTPSVRPDVSRAYPGVINATNAGFTADFDVSKLNLNHQYRIISRYASDVSGNHDYVDEWFNPQRLVPANLNSMGWLDKLDLSNPDQILATGWHAADVSNVESNRFIILFDNTAKRQVAAVKVNSVSRPDVQHAHPNIANADQSGFQAILRLDANAKKLINFDHTYSIVSRYSADPNGNGNDGQHTDWWSSPIRLNQDHYWIDTLQTDGQTINVQGWMVSDHVADQPHAFIFLMNNGKEVARQAVTLTARTDVAGVYSGVYGSLMSGFAAQFKLTPAQASQLNGRLQIMMRFSQDADGNPVNGRGTSDQYSQVYATKDVGNFDYIKVNGKQIDFRGWHNSLQSTAKPYKFVIALVNGREVGRIKLNDSQQNLENPGHNSNFWDNSRAGFEGTIHLDNAINSNNVQLLHRFSADPTGNSQYSDYWSPKFTVNYSYSQGSAYDAAARNATRQQLAKEIADDMTQAGKQDVEYDWTNTQNNYREFALHDIAQELANGGVADDPQIITQKLHDDDLLDGQVVTHQIIKYDGVVDVQKLAHDFVTGLKPNDSTLDHSVIGVGMTDKQLAIILFKPGQATPIQQASSTLKPTFSQVFKHAGVNVDVTGGLNAGQALPDKDQALLTQNTGMDILLKGPAGTVISQDVLKAIFAGLPGNGSNDQPLIGQQIFHHGQDSYHYEYWLTGNSNDEKLQNFLKANEGAKYGNPLKVSYTATLTWGAPTSTNSDDDQTPASAKSSDDLKLAYQTGTETGLRYDKVKVQKIPGMTDDMVRGVDISSYAALLKAGVKFYDFNGQEASLFKVLKDAGVNRVRLRVWNDPYNAAGQTYGGGDDDEADVLDLARQAKQYGIKVLLGFQYSDFYTDPGFQALPKAWENLDSANLTQEIQLYTSKVINDFKQAGALPDMLQIGNEVTAGCFGIVNGNWQGMWSSPNGALVADYLAAGTHAARQADPQAKIAIHLEGPNVTKYRRIMQVFQGHGVDYDELGVSYYPFWSGHGKNGSYDGEDLGRGASTPLNLKGVAAMAINEFGKQLVVLETAWLNGLQDSDGTANSVADGNPDVDNTVYLDTPQGQVDEMADLYQALADSGSAGAFYWEPAWIGVQAGWQNWEYNHAISDVLGTGWANKNSQDYYSHDKLYYQGKPAWGGSSWDNCALFDDHGHPLQSLQMFNGFLHGYETPTVVKKISTLSPVISQIFNNTDVTPNDGLAVDHDFKLENFIDGDIHEVLTGNANDMIRDAQLQQVAAKLKDGMQSAEFTAANGAKYHYNFWLQGSNPTDKAANFVAANHGKHYGDTLTVPYTATVYVDSEPGTQPAKQVTSPVRIKISKVYNSVNNYTPDIQGALEVGDVLTDADANLRGFQTKAIKQALTGNQGQSIDLAQLQHVQWPGKNSALMGTKDYKTSTGDHYYYEFWLEGIDNSTSYGSPLTLNYSASLKWKNKD